VDRRIGCCVLEESVDTRRTERSVSGEMVVVRSSRCYFLADIVCMETMSVQHKSVEP